jgi:hypothetical protein
LSLCRELKRLELCDRGSDTGKGLSGALAALAIELLELAKASGEQRGDRGGGHGWLSKGGETVARLMLYYTE